MIPARSFQAYDVLRRGAGLVERADFARIAVSGADRASYLHGLLTNDVASLKTGQGCYAAYLTPQGRMIADLWVYELGDVIILTMSKEVKETVIAKLDQFIFSEDVQLGDVSDTFPAVGVVGPEAAAVLSRALSIPEKTLADLPPYGNIRATFESQSAILLQVDDISEQGYDVLAEASIMERLRAALREFGATDVDRVAAEMLRVENGIPKFHQDMDEETIPLEAGIESRAISMTKGCYVGQEVIVRVLHRGHGRVVRRLVGLAFTDEAIPVEGGAVQANGHDIGKVTSAVWSPSLRRPIALAYVHRDFTSMGTVVTVAGRTAEVMALPFTSQHASAS